ncbi:PepSY-associated TM helix domain-containing protein [Herminiimonas sp. NPDC097707]|uniref:PepSY-associated TM helix domain-containing protein n=1 Tax=Herminiimonas sp. NPDC097707 TaxID=3364007 RepID=UPI00383B9FAF
MKEGFRQSMAWLHTWSGLLVCWVLFLVFSAGTASYFREEISLWMKPELHAAAATPVAASQAVHNAMLMLEKEAPGAARWFINLPDERNQTLEVLWIGQVAKGEKGRGKIERAQLNPATGERLPEARETRGGDFIYRLHYDLHYMPALWGRWIIGFCAMFMLVAIVSGIITHKRIFKDFFTFRPKKGQRSWLDAHNAVAVLALPYHLMITYTGLVTLMFMLMPFGTQAAYKGDAKAFIAEAFPQGENRKAAGRPAPLTTLAPLLAQAEKHWDGGEIGRVTINHPGDANATIQIRRQQEKKLSHVRQTMQFDGVSGTLMSTAGDEVSAAIESRGVLFGLHVANFANPLLRTLFFLCGLAGCAMVATGALLWAVKKRQAYAKVLAKGGRIGFGLRLVDGLNIGAIAGLPIAFTSYFWANRLLPTGLSGRADAEISCFFIAWGLAAVLAQIRPDRRMWQWQLRIGGVLFALLPLLNCFTTDTHLGVTLLQGKGPFAVAGFDLFVLGLGLLMIHAAKWLRPDKRKSAEPAVEKKPKAGDRAAYPEAT